MGITTERQDATLIARSLFEISGFGKIVPVYASRAMPWLNSDSDSGCNYRRAFWVFPARGPNSDLIPAGREE